MKKMTRILLGVLFFSTACFSSASAAFVWPVQEWKIPFLRTMNTPDGFSAIEVKDFRAFVEQEKKKLSDPKKAKKTGAGKSVPTDLIPAGSPDIVKEVLPADEEAAVQRFLKSNFALYHLSVDDKEAIHVAWFLLFRDGEKLPEKLDVFTKDIDPKQTEQLAELKKWVDDNIEKAQYTDEKNKVSVKLLEMMPLQPLPMQSGGKLWTTGGRVLITVDGMPFAFFSRLYALNVEGHLVIAALNGFDGERPFWDPVVRNLLLGLKAEPVKR